jgi:hypothetical protein
VKTKQKKSSGKIKQNVNVLVKWGNFFVKDTEHKRPTI